jgi:hypothetical protein
MGRAFTEFKNPVSTISALIEEITSSRWALFSSRIMELLDRWVSLRYNEFVRNLKVSSLALLFVRFTEGE